MVDDVEQLRKHEPEHKLVARYVEIAIKRMEEPQRGIGRMIQALLFALGNRLGMRPSRT